jgi:FkbM family methyltransferase
MFFDWNAETVISVLAILAILALFLALVLIRRTLGMFHGQVAGLQAQIDTARNDHNLWAARLQQEIGELRGQMQTVQGESATIIHGLAGDVRTASAAASTSATIVSELVATVNATSESVRWVESKTADAMTRLEELTASVDLLSRRPIPPLFIDPVLTSGDSESQLLAKAEAIAILRPLVPYPSWHTDAEYHNTDLSYKLRRWFWQYFHDRRRDGPIVVRWHDGTRLRIFLGNDISGQVYIAGCWEPNEFAFLDRILQPGMTFLDVGANDGMYTVFAAKRVGAEGTVWSFEPSTRELERLRFNLDLNGLTSRVFPVALADVTGQAQFMVAGYEHEGHNTLGAFAYEGVTGATETVELRKLDDLVAESPLPQIDVLKMDVEGAELRVLRGAVSVLKNHRPIILFEVSESSLRNQGTNGSELVEFVRQQGYTIYAFDSSTGLVIPASPGASADNLVGVPQEKTLPDTVRLPWPAQSNSNSAA